MGFGNNVLFGVMNVCFSRVSVWSFKILGHNSIVFGVRKWIIEPKLTRPHLFTLTKMRKRWGLKMRFYAFFSSILLSRCAHSIHVFSSMFDWIWNSMKHCKPPLDTPIVVKITRKRQEMKNIWINVWLSGFAQGWGASILIKLNAKQITLHW
jgi:hypothetical protein